MLYKLGWKVHLFYFLLFFFFYPYNLHLGTKIVKRNDD